MGLREIAERDLAVTLEDTTTGFGWPVTLTDPAGESASLNASTTDISQLIDPDTGVAVSGRLASATLRISSITAAGLGIPQGIADSALKPWRVTFNDINGSAHDFKVRESNPDRAIGLVVLILEAWNA